MKRIIQLSLICLLIITIFIFNKTYFSKNEKIILETDIPKDQLNKETDNNLIKNLKYEVRLDKNNQYIITSNLSEISYVNDVELVKMQNVKAIILDQNNVPLTIKSDYALYNNSNYNTDFSDNVQIQYLNNKIFSDKINLNFQNNMVKIFQNVSYIGLGSTLKADNIKIDLITKKVEIYMDDKNDNVELTKNR